MFLYRCFQYKSSCKGFPGLRSRIYFNYNCFLSGGYKEIILWQFGKKERLEVRNAVTTKEKVSEFCMEYFLVLRDFYINSDAGKECCRPGNYA